MNTIDEAIEEARRCVEVIQAQADDIAPRTFTEADREELDDAAKMLAGLIEVWT